MFHEYEEDKSKLMIHKTEPHPKYGVRVVEYVDMDTGEIISSKEARIKYGVTSVYPDASVRRQDKINNLKSSLKDFANFILKFRNKSCGFLVPFDRIIDYYSKYSGIRLGNVKRKIKPLIVAGVLDESEGVVMLHRDFMINSPIKTREDILSGPFVAGVIFDNIMARKGTSESIDSNLND